MNAINIPAKKSESRIRQSCDSLITWNILEILSFSSCLLLFSMEINFDKSALTEQNFFSIFTLNILPFQINVLANMFFETVHLQFPIPCKNFRFLLTGQNPTRKGLGSFHAQLRVFGLFQDLYYTSQYYEIFPAAFGTGKCLYLGYYLCGIFD